MNTNSIEEFNAEHPGFAPEGDPVPWTDPDLKAIVRLRFISDPGFPFWDLSYCYGVMRDGTEVRVQVPFFQLSKRRAKSEIVLAARRDGVYAAGLGVFEALSFCQ